jgi:hypothetical protein
LRYSIEAYEAGQLVETLGRETLGAPTIAYERCVENDCKRLMPRLSLCERRGEIRAMERFKSDGEHAEQCRRKRDRARVVSGQSTK